MPQVGFELTIQMFERARAVRVLDRADIKLVGSKMLLPIKTLLRTSNIHKMQ
jgi:hypothetical protein